MALDEGEEGLLVFCGQGTQGVSQSGTDVAASEFLLSRRR